MPTKNHRRDIIHGQLSMIDVLLRGTLYSLSIDRNGGPYELGSSSLYHARIPRTSTYTFEASTFRSDDPSLQELLSTVPDAELDDLLEDIHGLISSRLRGEHQAPKKDYAKELTRLIEKEEQKEKKQTGIDIDLS